MWRTTSAFRGVLDAAYDAGLADVGLGSRRNAVGHVAVDPREWGWEAVTGLG